MKNIHTGRPYRGRLDQASKLYEELPRLFPQLLSLVVEDPYFHLVDDNFNWIRDFCKLYRLQANVDDDLLEELFSEFPIFDLSFSLNGGQGAKGDLPGTNCTQGTNCLQHLADASSGSQQKFHILILFLYRDVH